MAAHDVIVLGGGPAGSTCARFLVQGGARVAVVDRAVFPRVKLCGGWLSASFWDELGISTRDYPGGLWPWQSCHVSYGGEQRSIRCRGWFIRRYELDDYLLRASGAELHLGVSVKAIERDPDGMWKIGDLRARHLIGAAGTHCPVARRLAPTRRQNPVGVQEHEFPADRDAIAETRAGGDGEPELLLHDDLRGYSWNVPKTDWLNVGTGTIEPNEVLAAWRLARAHFSNAGHIPVAASGALDSMKGHSYYLFDPDHITGAAQVDADGKGGAYLVGDSLGLAQPLTAEGLLPAVVSARLAAEAIVQGDPASYVARMRAHPVIADYERFFRMREAAGGLLKRQRSKPSGTPPSRLGRRAIATGFAWMFSGARLPAPRLIDLALAGAERWLGGDDRSAR